MKQSRVLKGIAAVLALSALLCATAGCSKKGSEKKPEEVLIPISGDCSLVAEGELDLSKPTLYINSSDEPQAQRAAGDLQTDFEKVTGTRPELSVDVAELSSTSIIIGTIGQSGMIDGLIDAGVLDVSEIADKWEGYKIAVYKNLTDTAEYSVVIAGSDTRGTIYGIYELSSQIGVSPWYWWGDVPIIENKNLTLSVAELSGSEAPDVKYRGIFINDEENLAAWSARFVRRTENLGTPRPEVYGHMFELLLRLKANTLYPAMHATSTAFNAVINPDTGIAYNAELADSYGIIMGSSHCEMLLCNNETEWVPWCEANEGKYHLKKLNNDWKASYDYTVNAEAMNAYWEDRVAANYRFDNIYTLGLRGVHDSGIAHSAVPNASYEQQAAYVKKAIEAQLAILEKYESILYEETGKEEHFVTCYCPYKEAAEYYKYDISLPEDCIIEYSDDNYGYVRQLPNASELNTYAGFGVYYHVSYRGVPRSYLWIDSTPLSQIYEEMNKAYNAGSDDLWILNVGDLKPAELPMDFFLKLAWSVDDFSPENLEDFTASFCRTNFALSESDAKEIASAMTEYYQVAIAYKPDYQGYNEGVEYSLVNFGDEAEIMITRAKRAEAVAAKIYDALPDIRKDSFYELIYYKTRCLRLTLELNVYAQKNQLAMSQGRFASINAYAALSEEAFAEIAADIKTYNSLQNGKWRGILNPYTTANGSPPIASKPSVTYISADLAEDGVKAASEGQTGGIPAELRFTSFTTSKRFIDIFSLGNTGYDFKLTADEALSFYDQNGKLLTGSASGGKVEYLGSVNVETRIWVGVNKEKLSGTYSGDIIISDNYGHTTKIPVLISALVDPSNETRFKGYFEENGIISIEAEHYTDSVAVGDCEWKLMPNLGVSGGSMKVFPDTSASSTNIGSDYSEKSAYLVYQIYVTTTGKYNGTLFRIPTLNEGTTNGRSAKTCRIVYSVDGGNVATLRGNTTVDTGGSSKWSYGVRYNIEKLSFSVSFDTVGWHELRIYQADAGMAFDKIELLHESLGALSSRLGAPETYQTVTDIEDQILPCPPELSFEGLKYEPASDDLNFDLTSDVDKAHSGYFGVDNLTDSIRTKRYGWLSGFDSLKAERRSASGTSDRDQGFIYSDNPAELRLVLSGAGKYIFTIAVGDRLASGISAVNMNVLANGTSVITGINVAAGNTAEYCFIIESTDGTVTLSFDGSWIVSAIEIRKYNDVEVGGASAFAPDENGDVIIEAESALNNTEFASNTASADDKKLHWMETGGIYGSALCFGPNGNSQYTSTDPNTGKTAKLNYKVDLPAGTYNLFALVKCQSDSDDSIIVLMDGKNAQTTNDFKDTAGFVWKKIGTFTVSQSGEHTITLMGREDGLVIDRLILTTKSSWK